jgi:hypothetical protein
VRLGPFWQGWGFHFARTLLYLPADGLQRRRDALGKGVAVLAPNRGVQVGRPKRRRGESKGHESGRRILKIKRKNKSDYTDDDVEHMKRVNGYVKRHLGQGPKNDVENSKWRYSLV